MAQTAKKFEARDLCLVYSENDPRVSSLRVAGRIHPTARLGSTILNEWVERNRVELERYGNLPCRTVKSGERGRPATEYLLNEDQVTIVIMRSDSKEAAGGRFEIVQLMRAYRRGEIPNSTITIIGDLFDPKPPTITQGEGNVVEVTWRDQPPLIQEQKNAEANRRHIDAMCGITSHQPAFTRLHDEDAFEPYNDLWNEECDGVTFNIALRNGKSDLTFLFMSRADDCAALVLPREGKVVYGEEGKQVLLLADKGVPIEVIERAYLTLPQGRYTDVGLATVRQLFD
jgi:hypothetical protein